MNYLALINSYRSQFTQANRLLSLQVGQSARGEQKLLALSVEGQERLSDVGTQYQLLALSEDGALELANLIGQGACLTIRAADGQPVYRSGIIDSATLLGGDGGFACYRLSIVPPLALLEQRVTSRVFQNKTVEQIIQQVLTEHRQANPVLAQYFRWQLRLTQPQAQLPRSFTIQYRESDSHFLRRLMAEEGYSWFSRAYAEDPAMVELVVIDSHYRLAQAQQGAVSFQRHASTEQQDALQHWQPGRCVTAGYQDLCSYNYKMTQASHSGDNSRLRLGRAAEQLQSTLSVYDSPGQYYAGNSAALGHYATLRQQVLDAQSYQITAQGTVRPVRVGEWFRLDNHPSMQNLPAEQREYIITRLHFKARSNLPGEFSRLLQQAAPGLVSYLPDASQAEPPYQCQLQLHPRSLPLAPAYAGTALAKPTAPGVQTAIVVGPPGEEVYTDELGRVKVQFHWARPQEHADGVGAAFNHNSSCWLRVALASAGSCWGTQFIPRVGQEVLVDFIEGDIDRPLICGVLHNANQAVTRFSQMTELPGNKTLSGIKTREHDGRGYSQLLFDDTRQQVRSQLFSSHGYAQLQLGYLTQPRRVAKASSCRPGCKAQYAAPRACCSAPSPARTPGSNWIGQR